MKKLFTLLLLLFATATSALATDLYLRGESNSWAANEASKFTDNGDGTFTLNYKGILTGSFKIADSNWGTHNYGGPGTIEVDSPFTVNSGSNSGNITMKEAVENPTLEFNLNTKILLLKGQAAKVEYVWKIHMPSKETAVNEKGETYFVWKSFDMTEEPDGTWTLKKADWNNCEFGLKKCVKGAADGSWFAAVKGKGVIDIPQNKWDYKSEKYAVTDTNTDNFKLNHTGEAKLIFNPATMELSFEDCTPTGVADIADENAAPVYYNMQGVKMGANALVPGIYIVKQGKTTKKVVVK